jgi:hypothetical protein
MQTFYYSIVWTFLAFTAGTNYDSGSTVGVVLFALASLGLQYWYFNRDEIRGIVESVKGRGTA